MKDNGKVIPFSCFAGYGRNATPAIDNFAEFIHDTVWPQTYLYAAVSYGSLVIELNAQDLFERAVFGIETSFVIPPYGGTAR